MTSRGDDNDPGNENGEMHGDASPFRVVENTEGENSASQKNASEAAGANDEAVLLRIASLEQDHSDLHKAIEALEEKSGRDPLVLARLKKKKLQIKDEIEKLRDALTPDIIA